MPPAKRKASKPVSSAGSDDEDYRIKRDRNNEVLVCLFFFFSYLFQFWEMLLVNSIDLDYVKTQIK